MIIKLSNDSILADGNPVASNIRMNIQSLDRIRIMMDAVTKGGVKPVDICIYQLHLRIHKIGVKLDLSGEERVGQNKFSVAINYAALKREWSAAGNIGHRSIQLKNQNLIEVILSLIKYFA